MNTRILTAVLAVMIFCAGGCIFETRDPVTPGGGEEDTWVTVEEATDVFINLASGFSERANSNYERSLSDEFLFEATDFDKNNYPGILDGWGKSSELDFLNKIKGDYTGERSVRFGDEDGEFDQVNLEADEPWVEGEYVIILDGEASFGGIARFTFVRSSQPKYQLKEWRDLDFLGDYSTSGSLRGQNPPGQ